MIFFSISNRCGVEISSSKSITSSSIAKDKRIGFIAEPNSYASTNALFFCIDLIGSLGLYDG